VKCPNAGYLTTATNGKNQDVIFIKKIGVDLFYSYYILTNKNEYKSAEEIRHFFNGR